MKSRDKLLPYSGGDQYQGKSVRQVFQEIFEGKTWQMEQAGSISGPGSSLEQTRELSRQLPPVFKKLGIISVLDIPCGDFGWMQHVALDGIKYIGADIVETLVITNQKLYSSENREFKKLDLLTDELPPVDLIFCRDCLVHLSFRDISLCLENIKSSQAKYFMATNFAEENLNKDIKTGGWRPLDFCIWPFDFPSPQLMVFEKCTEMNGAFQDKSMALWEVSELP